MNLESQDIVFIESLEVDASVGVFDWEKQIKQRLVYDVDLYVDCAAASKTDDIADAIDYAAVSDTIIRVTTEKHTDLLECLADKVISTIFSEFPVKGVKIKLSKPGAVKGAKSVGVKFTRFRGH